jgi:methyl-accepting chemotaxis protein
MSPQAQYDLALEIGDISELQTAQLQNSSDELEHAINTITGSLHAISSKGGALAAEVRKMAGVSDQTDQSFFSTMEKELAGVTNVLAESAQENNRLTTAMGTVIGTIGEIITFVRDIETIGEEIELIALNAQIKAARVGSEGAALGVLAEAIQRLSIDTMEQTAAVSRPLQSITAVTERLQGRVAEDSAAIDHDIQAMLDELTISLQEICDIQNEVFSLVASIDGTVDTLQTEIEAGIAGIAAHEELSRAIADTRQAAEQVSMAARRNFPPPVGQSAAERLKELAARYTMHSERKVHEVITGKGSGGAVHEKLPPIGGTFIGDQASSADGLGDNVELF